MAIANLKVKIDSEGMLAKVQEINEKAQELDRLIKEEHERRICFLRQRRPYQGIGRGNRKVKPPQGTPRERKLRQTICCRNSCQGQCLYQAELS